MNSTDYALTGKKICNQDKWMVLPLPLNHLSYRCVDKIRRSRLALCD